MEKATTNNSSYRNGGVLRFKDSFVVNEIFVLLIKFCANSPALRVAAKPIAVFFFELK